MWEVNLLLAIMLIFSSLLVKTRAPRKKPQQQQGHRIIWNQTQTFLVPSGQSSSLPKRIVITVLETSIHPTLAQHVLCEKSVLMHTLK